MSRPSLDIPNLAEPKTHVAADIGETWRRLRSEDPVHWHTQRGQQPGFWVITRYADVMEALRDDTNFTCERGNVLDTMLHGGDGGAGRMMPVTDGPFHTSMRRLLLQAFAPRQLAGVTHRLRQMVQRLLSAAIDRGGCDFARDIASVVPLQSICDLLEVPVADRDHLFRLTKAALASDYAAPEAGVDRMARTEILLYFHDLLQMRRKKPGGDPISLMATAEVDGGRLTDEDIVLNLYSIIIGGDETARLSMIGAVQTLARWPDQWKALRDGSVGLESAVEEVLRWTSPTMHLGRAAVRDTVLGGTTGRPVPPRSDPRPARLFPLPGNATGHGRPVRCRHYATTRSSSTWPTSAAGYAADRPTDNRSGSGRRSNSRSPATRSGSDAPTLMGVLPSTPPGMDALARRHHRTVRARADRRRPAKRPAHEVRQRLGGMDEKLGHAVGRIP